MKPEPVLWFENMSIGYTTPHRSVIKAEMSATLNAGELVCLLGPNGVGKSTLMRTLIGIQPSLAGQLTLDGQPLRAYSAAELARRIAVVLTERVDVGNLSAYALVALGRYPHTNWSGRLTAADEQIVQWALTATNSVALSHRHISELSDGERQRIMIARALAQEPKLIVLDEPTAFLDLPRRVETMRLLRGLARENNKAILLSTHDLDLALRYADRIWLLAKDGMFSVGAPEELILTGAFQEAFRSEGLEFDNTTGSFKIQQSQRAPINIIGDGQPAFWTQRALEREGFEIVKQQSALTVKIVSKGNDTRWQLIQGQNCYEYNSLSDLMSEIRESASQ